MRTPPITEINAGSRVLMVRHLLTELNIYLKKETIDVIN